VILVSDSRCRRVSPGPRAQLGGADGWRWASGDPTSYLPVAPPLGRSARVEIIAAGRPAEVRANVPLQWR
jgi:hypothetical protein